MQSVDPADRKPCCGQINDLYLDESYTNVVASFPVNMVARNNVRGIELPLFNAFAVTNALARRLIPTAGAFERGRAHHDRPERDQAAPVSPVAVHQLHRARASCRGGRGTARHDPVRLTLTGSGGCGKRRLAVEVAAQTAADYADGTWFVESAAVTDPRQVPHAVAAVIGLREALDRPLTASLLEYVGDKHVLVVLDNCEHVVSAAAQLADALLGGTERHTHPRHQPRAARLRWGDHVARAIPEPGRVGEAVHRARTCGAAGCSRA